MAGTDFLPAVNRERVPLKIRPDLLEWVGQHCEAGGVFGTYSQAVERGLGRLRLEHDTVRERCKREGASFQPTAFWKLYEADLAASKPGKSGPRFKHAENDPMRDRAYASVAVELLIWARDTLVEGGPFEGMSQVAEVGLRRLQGDDLDEAGHARRPFDAEALWRSYQAASRKGR